MSLASSASLLVLALLAHAPDAAEPSHPDECETASSRIELAAEPTGKLPVICGSARTSTTLRFDSPLLPESVKVEERARFEDVALGRATLTLVPPGNMVPGERFKVEVCFADGAAPPCATFLLLAHPRLGMSQVEVFRQVRPVAYYQQAEKEAQAEIRRLREEVRQLRAERGVPDGLRGVLASGLVGAAGIASWDLTERVIDREGNALINWRIVGYRAEGRVAVSVCLVNPGAAPWTAAGAVLRSAMGEVLKPLPLWQPEPILPNEPVGECEQRGRVVVEVLATAKNARGTYTLTLWDAEKKRTVSFGNISFP